MRRDVDSVVGWAEGIGCALAVLWLLIGWFRPDGWPFWLYAALAGHAAAAPFLAHLLTWLGPKGGSEVRDGRIAFVAFSPLLLAIVIAAVRALV